MTDETTVTRNDESSQYEIRVDGVLGGFLSFEPLDGGEMLLSHTEVDPGYKGQGLGSKLAAGALADLARRGDVVVPTCPFLAHYLGENEVAGLQVQWPDEEDASDAPPTGEPA